MHGRAHPVIKWASPLRERVWCCPSGGQRSSDNSPNAGLADGFLLFSASAAVYIHLLFLEASGSITKVLPLRRQGNLPLAFRGLATRRAKSCSKAFRWRACVKRSRLHVIPHGTGGQKAIPAHSGLLSDTMIKAKGALKALDLY